MVKGRQLAHSDQFNNRSCCLPSIMSCGGGERQTERDSERDRHTDKQRLRDKKRVKEREGGRE